MNIAFWGGCINRQQNIKPDRHYHAIVRNAIGEYTGIVPKTWMGFYSSFCEMHRDTVALLNGNEHYDYLVIFLRPFTLQPLTKPFIRYTDKKMRNRLALHPRYTKTKFYDDMVKEYKIVTPGIESSGFTHSILQRFNDLAGDILGLQQWAQNEVLDILTEIQTVAVHKQTKLILLGPAPYPFNRRIDNCCQQLSGQVSAFARLNKIAHVDMSEGVDAAGKSFSEPDGKHVTEAGHAFMASGIIKCIQQNVAMRIVPVTE